MDETDVESAVQRSPHFCAIVLDGVFTNRGIGKTPVFRPIPPPTDADIAKLARNLRNRIVGLLLRRGVKAGLWARAAVLHHDLATEFAEPAQA